MIKIEPHNLSQLVNNHYEQVGKKLVNEYPTKSKYSLEEVIKATPEKLIEIVGWVNQNPSNEYHFMLNKYKNFRNKEKKEYCAYELAEKLNINVCPYCNLNSIYTITSGGNRVLRPEFDHFYDQASYPILALSFFNLIPSCHACNSSLKGSKHFDFKKNINPYQESFNDFAKFKLTLKDASFYYSEAGFEVKLDTNNNKKADIHEDIFKLNERYEKHKDIVLELIQKKEMYPDSYVDDLLRKYEGTFFKNREDLLRLITGSFITEEEIGNRPLSKLVKDISEELDY